MEKKTYYQILSIQPSSSIRQIKMSFKKLIRQHHPDKYHSSQIDDISHLLNLQSKKQVSMKIIEAYQCLMDSQKRKVYDHWLNNQILKQKISQMRHKDIISLSTKCKNPNSQSLQSNTKKSTPLKQNQSQKSSQNPTNQSFNSDQQQDDFTVLVCQQCFGEMQVQNQKFQQLHLKQLSINCRHCGLYISIVQ